MKIVSITVVTQRVPRNSPYVVIVWDDDKVQYLDYDVDKPDTTRLRAIQDAINIRLAEL